MPTCPTADDIVSAIYPIIMSESAAITFDMSTLHQGVPTVPTVSQISNGVVSALGNSELGSEPCISHPTPRKLRLTKLDSSKKPWSSKKCVGGGGLCDEPTPMCKACRNAQATADACLANKRNAPGSVNFKCLDI